MRHGFLKEATAASENLDVASPFSIEFPSTVRAGSVVTGVLVARQSTELDRIDVSLRCRNQRNRHRIHAIDTTVEFGGPIERGQRQAFRLAVPAWVLPSIITTVGHVQWELVVGATEVLGRTARMPVTIEPPPPTTPLPDRLPPRTRAKLEAAQAPYGRAVPLGRVGGSFLTSFNTLGRALVCVLLAICSFAWGWSIAGLTLLGAAAWLAVAACRRIRGAVAEGTTAPAVEHLCVPIVAETGTAVKVSWRRVPGAAKVGVRCRRGGGLRGATLWESWQGIDTDPGTERPSGTGSGSVEFAIPVEAPPTIDGGAHGVWWEAVVIDRAERVGFVRSFHVVARPRAGIGFHAVVDPTEPTAGEVMETRP